MNFARIEETVYLVLQITVVALLELVTLWLIVWLILESKPPLC